MDEVDWQCRSSAGEVRITSVGGMAVPEKLGIGVVRHRPLEDGQERPDTSLFISKAHTTKSNLA
jgi:hypothetical protein